MGEEEVKRIQWHIREWLQFGIHMTATAAAAAVITAVIMCPDAVVAITRNVDYCREINVNSPRKREQHFEGNWV